ncbi:TetR family transcriptional regulator [Enterobacter sp. PGRG2]|uniref:TetR family transcriptional regulator n=1 Tax=Enterobacter sp. PGRG2 TaxID=3104013 RepID=UPI002ABD154D|nr:TetR family transcriptional regulator [Enterobacter sp. PGRG2]WJD48525.1 TetR family transcriptional regulator [Enterobacter sp. PGRG2]
MNYLNREDRRENILLAAMRVALDEGLSAMTVRRIASVAGVAAGQVHHHFASTSELRALAFIRLIRVLLDTEVVPEDASWRQRLHSMLGSDDRGFERYIKLWREAQLMAMRDPEIKGAYVLTMEMWHEEAMKIIHAGQQAGEFTLSDSVENVAWRLIALVCGLDGMHVLGLEGLDDEAFDRHIDRAIELELNR